MTTSHVLKKTGLFGSLILAVLVTSLYIMPPTPATGQTVQQLIGSYVRDSSDPQYKDIEQAIIYFRNRDVKNAQASLERAVKANPSLPPANVLLAQLLFGANQAQAAQMALESAAKDFPQDPEAYVVMGDLMARQRSITAAQLLFQKANVLTEKYDRNLLRKKNLQKRVKAGLAATAEAKGDWANAEKYYNEWLKLDPDNASAAARLGRTLFQAKKFKEAYAFIQKYYESHKSTTPRYELTMAQLYESAPKDFAPGSDRLAKQLIDFAATRDPNNPQTRLAVAQWGMRNGELGLSKTNANAVLSIKDDKAKGIKAASPAVKASAKLLLGQLARYEKDYATAEKLFREVHAQLPTNFQANNYLALSLLAQNDDAKRNEAVSYAQLNNQLVKGSKSAEERQAAITLAWILYSVQREAEAQRVIAQVLNSKGSLNIESAFLAAKMLSDREPSIALRILEPTLKNTAFFPQRKEAEKLLDELKKKAPTTPNK